MTKFRHLIWMVIAAVGLTLSISPSLAQKPDVGDQPGLQRHLYGFHARLVDVDPNSYNNVDTVTGQP